MQHIIDRILNEEEKARLDKIKRLKPKPTRWIRNVLLDIGRSWFGLEFEK